LRLKVHSEQSVSRKVNTMEFKRTEYLCPYNPAPLFGELFTPDDGQDSHPLIIISHGMYYSHEMTAGSALALVRHGFACYTFDYRGCSYTNRSGGDLLSCSILTERDELVAVIDHFAAQKSIDPNRIFIIGQSLGGVVAALAAARRPAQVSKMILMYPAFHAFDAMAQTYPSVEAVPEVIENYLGIPGLTLGGMFITDILKCQFDDEIRPYDHPVLVIHGTADELVPLSYVEKAAASYSQSRLLVIPEAGHGFQVDDTTVNDVVDFLNE